MALLTTTSWPPMTRPGPAGTENTWAAEKLPVMFALPKSAGPSNIAFRKNVPPPTFMLLKIAGASNALSSNEATPAKLALLKFTVLLNWQ